MLKRYAFMALAMTLVAAPAMADDPDGPYDNLSGGNKQIVDSMHFFQEPPDDSDPLTKDQMAALKIDGGWGKVFHILKTDGYFDDYRNLGALVSGWNHERIGLHTDGPGASWKRPGSGVAGFSRGWGRGHFTRPSRSHAMNRPSRPVRPIRPTRPSRGR